jgi:hypothetical protein
MYIFITHSVIHVGRFELGNRISHKFTWQLTGIITGGRPEVSLHAIFQIVIAPSRIGNYVGDGQGFSRRQKSISKISKKFLK